MGVEHGGGGEMLLWGVCLACLIVSVEIWIMYNFCGFIMYRLTQYPTQTLLIYTLVNCFVPCRLSMLKL